MWVSGSLKGPWVLETKATNGATIVMLACEADQTNNVPLSPKQGCSTLSLLILLGGPRFGEAAMGMDLPGILGSNPTETVAPSPKP